MVKNKNPPFHIAIFGVFLILGFLVYIMDLLESNAIESNPQYVDGVVMCEYPYHWKGMDYVCFQYQIGSELYVGKVVGGGVINGYIAGQKCRVIYDGENPKNSKVVGLLPQLGDVMSQDTFAGTVISVEGGCTCE